MSYRLGPSILMICIVLSMPLTSANPLIIELSDAGVIYPSNDTQIYLKSEKIIIAFSESIHEEYSYTLMNPTSVEENVTLLIPLSIFYRYGSFEEMINSTIENIHFQIDDIECTYYRWTNETLNLLNETLNLVSLEVKLNFAPYEEKTLSIGFDRVISLYYDDLTYRYITTTGRLWNHSIDDAEFKFIFNEKVLFVDAHGMDGYNQATTDGNTVISAHYTNWVPEEDIFIYIDKAPESKTDRTWVVWAIMISFVILITALVLFWLAFKR